MGVSDLDSLDGCILVRCRKEFVGKLLCILTIQWKESTLGNSYILLYLVYDCSWLRYIFYLYRGCVSIFLNSKSVSRSAAQPRSLAKAAVDPCCQAAKLQFLTSDNIVPLLPRLCTHRCREISSRGYEIAVSVETCDRSLRDTVRMESAEVTRWSRCAGSAVLAVIFLAGVSSGGR